MQRPLLGSCHSLAHDREWVERGLSDFERKSRPACRLDDILDPCLSPDREPLSLRNYTYGIISGRRWKTSSSSGG